jgi:protein-disulfide isomerase
MMPIAVVIAGAFIAVAIYFSGGGTGVRTPIVQQPVDQQPSTAVDASKVNMKDVPFIGKATAPLTIVYFFDYQCPFCQQHEKVSMGPLVKEYVETGKVKLVFKDFAFLGADSQTLGQYARAVWAYAPDKFYDWHHAVYVNQGAEHSGWATPAEIARIGTPILGADGVAKVAALVKANGAAYQKAMDADKAEGSALGVGGTPAMIIGTMFVPGAVPYADVKSVIDAQLAKK